jgi:ABC-2 type transport system permease protein
MGGLDAGGSGMAGAGPLSATARSQYAALASMRWRMFQNGLRSNLGVVELGARTFTYLIYGVMGLGLSAGLGVAAYFMAAGERWRLLPILMWIVFLIWQMLPVMLASFQEQFDLSILLRFPVSFGAFMVLYLLFGLIDVSTITGGLCCLGLWIGITVARPDLFAWMALGLAGFAAFNVLLARAIFAWIDRWLAQRRTREIVGAIFLLGVLGIQLLNPAVYEGRHAGRESRADRYASQRRMMAGMRPWLSRANAVQAWLPPGLAAETPRRAQAARPTAALGSLGMLGMYVLAAGGVLAWRLRAEYRGESLGEAPSRKKAQKRESGWLLDGSGPIAAVMEKELRTLLRTLPLLYAVGAPLVLMVVFASVFVKTGSQGHAFPLALPACMVYAQLGFTQLFYNNLGAEGMGIQLYFLSPTPIGKVLLGKNLFHAALFALVGVQAGVLASLRLGTPDAAVIAATAAWLLFSLPCNLAAGNIFSLTMPYRINPGRMTRQRGSQANALLSLLVQLAAMAVGASVFGLTWFLDQQWLAAPIFLALAAGAVLAWRRGLRNADALANSRKDALIATLAKAA